MYARGSGILLHPTSLPGPFGTGDLGPEAYRFVDFLASARQSLWQVLPLNPPGSEWSPYDGRSTFAGNPLLISPEGLVELGLIDVGELDLAGLEASERADFPEARRLKGALVRQAFEQFRLAAAPELMEALARFAAHEAIWLDDYALYEAIHEAHGGRPWFEWEPDLVHRLPGALARWREVLRDEVDFHRFVQYLFSRQWSALKRHANERGVRIVGDLPIYVAYDSADVWAHQGLFTLDDDGRPTVVAGVPPDLFSATGQLWGNPCYRWDVLEAHGFRWWVDRLRRALDLADLIRIDHFRGFKAGWQVPAGQPTAMHGAWVPGPGIRIFETLRANLGRLPIIVEDLGVITPDVVALREALGYPGMKVLQFAFGGGGSENPYLPHNYERNAVVYTGTHDNDTTVGWFRAVPETERHAVMRYLDRSGEEINWDLIRLALMSTADLAVMPLQDVLGLDSAARMNLPGTAYGNWTWRFRSWELTSEHAARLAEMTEIYGRVAKR